LLLREESSGMILKVKCSTSYLMPQNTFSFYSRLLVC
jgi:hypothetical protein